jgi:hypothetical protein
MFNMSTAWMNMLIHKPEFCNNIYTIKFSQRWSLDPTTIDAEESFIYTVALLCTFF